MSISWLCLCCDDDDICQHFLILCILIFDTSMGVDIFQNSLSMACVNVDETFLFRLILFRHLGLDESIIITNEGLQNVY